MGFSLSCFRQPSPQRLLTDREDRSIKNDRSSFSGMPFLGCLWSKETKKRQLQQKEDQQQLKKAKEVTLEDWLKSSPGRGLQQKHNGGAEYHVFKHTSKRVFPSFIGDYGKSSSSKPRQSFSKESLLKSEDHVEKENMEVSFSRSQSERSKKKVSFRLPEEADIFIFHSSSSSSEESGDQK